jgi:small multidrug resistance pump
VGWMRIVFLAAAAYNVLRGEFVVLFPLARFRVLGMETPSYLQIWQCVGMLVGVDGVGYAVTALYPVRHWLVELAGLFGKILGPIAFLSAVIGGTFLLSFGVTILKNDLICCTSSPSSSSEPTRPAVRCETNA